MPKPDRPSPLLPLLSWLAFPVYVWQGVGVRLRTERMLPAQGRVLHRFSGKGKPFNLLVIGDSSAASVGIGSTDHGFAAQLAGLVSSRTGRPVAWRAAGFNSATAGQLRDFVVPNLAAGDWTHIVIAVGTNDMKNFHTARRFKAEFGGLLYALRAKWPEARVGLVTGHRHAAGARTAAPAGKAAGSEGTASQPCRYAIVSGTRGRRRVAAAGRRPASRLFARRLPRFGSRLRRLGPPSAALRDGRGAY